MTAREIDWSKWRQTPQGWVRVPPAACPEGHRWTQSGPGRPVQRFVTCTCGTVRHHVVWVCPTCASHSAEGCRDVTKWDGHSVPTGASATRRRTV